MASAQLSSVGLPDFGMPEAMPDLSPRLYRGRVDRLRPRARERGYDAVLVHADREHRASMSYLAGSDPRLGEALYRAAGRDGGFRTAAAPRL